MSKEENHAFEAVAWLNPSLVCQGGQKRDPQGGLAPDQEDSASLPDGLTQTDSPPIGNPEHDLDNSQESGSLEDSKDEQSPTIPCKLRDRISWAW